MIYLLPSRQLKRKLGFSRLPSTASACCQCLIYHTHVGGVRGCASSSSARRTSLAKGARSLGRNSRPMDNSKARHNCLHHLRFSSLPHNLFLLACKDQNMPTWQHSVQRGCVRKLTRRHGTSRPAHHNQTRMHGARLAHQWHCSCSEIVIFCLRTPTIMVPVLYCIVRSHTAHAY